MYFTPHIIEKRHEEEEMTDDLGRPIPVDCDERWEYVCRGRCDHTDGQEITLDDGTVARCDYHVVCNTNVPNAKSGDYIRCRWPNGTVRGEGKVIKHKTLNYLNYGEIFLQIQF